MLVVVDAGIKKGRDRADVSASKFRVVGGKLIDSVAGNMIRGKGPC